MIQMDVVFMQNANLNRDAVVIQALNNIQCLYLTDHHPLGCNIIRI